VHALHDEVQHLLQRWQIHVPVDSGLRSQLSGNRQPPRPGDMWHFALFVQRTSAEAGSMPGWIWSEVINFNKGIDCRGQFMKRAVLRRFFIPPLTQLKSDASIGPPGVLRIHHTLFYSIVTNGQIGIALAVDIRQRLQ